MGRQRQVLAPWRDASASALYADFDHLGVVEDQLANLEVLLGSLLSGSLLKTSAVGIAGVPVCVAGCQAGLDLWIGDMCLTFWMRRQVL